MMLYTGYIFMRFLFSFLLITIMAFSQGPTKQFEKKSLSDSITLLVVEKGKRQLHAYGEKGLIKTYKVALGFSPEGHKAKQGDGKTPEGKYSISAKNPRSKFYKSLRVSYPSPEDRKNSLKQGILDPGGDIMVHGLGKWLAYRGERHCEKDWTLGCVAVTNDEIEEIYEAIQVGCTIEIRA